MKKNKLRAVCKHVSALAHMHGTRQPRPLPVHGCNAPDSCGRGTSDAYGSVDDQRDHTDHSHTLHTIQPRPLQCCIAVRIFLSISGGGVGPSSGGGPSRPQITRKFAPHFRRYGSFSCWRALSNPRQLCAPGAGDMGASICHIQNIVGALDSGHKTRHRAGAGRISGLIRLHHCDGPRLRYPPRRARGQGHPR